MVGRKARACAVVLIVAAALIAAFVYLNFPASPLVKVVGIEPAGIFEENGQEMLIVTLSVSMRSPKGSTRCVFVKDGDPPVEVKVADHWMSVPHGWWAGCELWPAKSHEGLVLMPGRTQSCRVRLQYTNGCLSEARAVWLARHLPRWVPGYSGIWNWLRVAPYRPRKHWRKVTIEVPLEK